MKNLYGAITILSFAALLLVPVMYAGAPFAAQTPGPATGEEGAKGAAPVKGGGGNELVIADFNTGDKPNNIGGDFGGWDKDPEDETQGCQMSFEQDDALGDKAGYSIRLDYDVDSSNPAYNGFWMKLGGADASAYKNLVFYMRGDGTSGHTKKVKIELKDKSNVPSSYILSGVTDKWQKFTIPFDKFRKIQDWKALNEFVVVFDDQNSDPKKGTIFVDQVAFTK